MIKFSCENECNEWLHPPSKQNPGLQPGLVLFCGERGITRRFAACDPVLESHANQNQSA